MSTVAVDGAGYTNASAALADANRWAAFRVDRLSDSLADTGAMAGDSSFADEFAAAYDEAAAATLGAFDDLVGALGSLSRITYCSFENHARAELSSIASTVVVSTEPDPMSHYLYESASPTPPSSLGGDASFAPGWANVILDHVEGFVWPDADVDRLRSTAEAWRTAAGELDEVIRLVNLATNEIWEERSPEVPHAVDAIAGVGSDARDLASACVDVAGFCDGYADAVEEHRQMILDLVTDLIRDAILIAAAGFVLGLVTGGGGNAVAAWINSGKLAAQLPRFKAILDALRVYGAGVAAALRTATSSVAQVVVRLHRWHRARVIRYGAERGAVSLVKPVSWLRTHEGGPMKAHTLAKHVGKSNRFLRRRLLNEPTRVEVSTFTNERIAEHSIRSVLKSKASIVETWLKSSNPQKLRLDDVMPEDVGRIMNRAGDVSPARGVRVILVKDASMPDGYRIFTSMVQ